MGFNLQQPRAFGQDKTNSTNRLSVASAALTAASGHSSSKDHHHPHVPKERFTGKPQAKTSEEMLIEEIQRKRELKARLKQKRQLYYKEKVVAGAAEKTTERDVLVAVGVKKVMAQPATQPQGFKFHTDQRNRKSLVINKKDLLSPTKSQQRKEKLFNKRLLGSGKKTEPVPFNLTGV